MVDYSMFGVIVLLHHPTSATFQMTDSRPDIVQEHILVNMELIFPLFDGKWSRPDSVKQITMFLMNNKLKKSECYKPQLQTHFINWTLAKQTTDSKQLLLK